LCCGIVIAVIVIHVIVVAFVVAAFLCFGCFSLVFVARK